MLMGALLMSMTELGSGDLPGLCAGPRLQVCTPFHQLVSLHDCRDVDTHTHSVVRTTTTTTFCSVNP